MRKPLIALVALLVVVAGLAVYLESRDTHDGGPLAMIDAYCVDCHNAAEYAGELVLENRGAAAIHADADVWEAVIKKLTSRLMPPSGEPRPDSGAIDEFVDWLETSIDRAAEAVPDPGRPVLRRLNRNEYANAVADLLAIPIDATTLLPADDSSGGFDNIASALSVSPAHMQAYVSAAAKISRLAVGDMTTSAAITNYRPAPGLDQADHLEGLPLGTRGGMSVEHVFPLDGEYEITVNRSRSLFQLSSVGADQPTEVALNGEVVRRLDNGDSNRFRIFVPAGPQTITATVVRTNRPRGVDDMYEVFALSPGINGLSILGPFDPSGPGDTPSRRRIFVCTPSSPSEEDACAREILKTLASRAFRHPVDDADPSLETLMRFYDDGAALRGFETGIQYALARVLVDPQFLFLFEREPAGLEVGEVYDIGDFELASRLALFLWSSIPDDELISLAGAAQLTEQGVLSAQVTRMLGDDRSRALVENFASQWLLLRQLDVLNPLGDFDGNLRMAMRHETEMLVETIMREDRSIVDLIDADFTFVDERLARHYGIPHLRGSRLRRVSLEGMPRRGLLGHGSVLAATSPPNRTSPVARGSWVLANLLGTPPPEPPPGVDTDLDARAAREPTPRTMRQRLEQHRVDPNCAACHDIIDPIGFALENFDMTGRWRETDAGRPIDPTGELWDGTPIVGPEGLNAALLDRRELFVVAFTEKLLTYALGRVIDHRDMPAVRAVVRAAAAEDYRFSAFVRGVVNSVPFRKRTKLSGQESG